ncbi:MAG: hypothetical protein AAF191_02520, partial [Verrucomicrobiota bacterium]
GGRPGKVAKKMPVLEITTDPNVLSAVFDASHNPPDDPNTDDFDKEYCSVHSSFERHIAKVIPPAMFQDDDLDISLSPRSTASSRKIGLLIEDDLANMSQLTDEILDFLELCSCDYLITMNVSCEEGEGYFCYTRDHVTAMGDLDCLRVFQLTEKNPRLTMKR